MASRPIIKLLSRTRIHLDGTDAEFVLADTNATLTNSRVATSTSSVELDNATAGQTKWNVAVGGVTNVMLAPGAVDTDAIGATVATKTMLVPAAGIAKLGGSGAGWVIDADTALPTVTLPAGQTSEVLLIPIPCLMVGDTVTGVGVVGQIEAAGNTVTMSLDLRKVTAAAADITDASLATDSLGAGVIADTILSASNLGVTGLTEVLAADELLYVLITATTGAATDIALMGLSVAFTRPVI